MIFAELRREGWETEVYYTLRYLVFNGDTIGSYGVHYGPNGPYGASRDFHQRIDEQEIERVKAYHRWADGGYEGDSPGVGYGTYLNDCDYHDGATCVCDGSSLVEVITDNDQRCFEIAAMMAGVDRNV